MAERAEVTVLLRNLSNGDQSALDELIPLVYRELRRIADGYLRVERRAHTLQPTALVHEAYLRLVGQDQPDYQNRAHFYGVAAQVMRQILVDHSRRFRAAKRGGGAVKLRLDEVPELAVERAELVVRLDETLNELKEQDPLKAQLVEMRFFGGLTAEESAEALGLPVQKVRRQLRVAQAWLQRELDGQPEEKPERRANLPAGSRLPD
jgi:RNA polymerase sigma factor (TIGR02999 family)